MSDAADPPASTPLTDLHIELGARLVPFAGTSMPLQFTGILEEHRHTREAAGLFDVSHMGQIVIEGDLQALETLVPADIQGLAEGRQQYTVFTTPEGGIVDDLMVARLPGRLHLVVNAAFKATDLGHLRAGLDGHCEVRALADQALLALQGPAAAAVLATHCDAVAGMGFMDVRDTLVAGVPALVTRSGYTGEDGFEVAVPAAAAETLARLLLTDPRVAPVGLGARDSLRLEAGLCLSGTDIHAHTTPVEAGLGWVVARRYRGEGAATARFPGAATILAQLADGAPRRRIGLRPDGRIPLRGGAVLLDPDGREVGEVTSGSFGPSVGHPVAMGYVNAGLASNTPLSVNIRGRDHAVHIAALPFVPHRYHRH